MQLKCIVGKLAPKTCLKWFKAGWWFSGVSDATAGSTTDLIALEICISLRYGDADIGQNTYKITVSAGVSAGSISFVLKKQVMTFIHPKKLVDLLTRTKICQRPYRHVRWSQWYYEDRGFQGWNGSSTSCASMAKRYDMVKGQLGRLSNVSGNACAGAPAVSTCIICYEIDSIVNWNQSFSHCLFSYFLKDIWNQHFEIGSFRSSERLSIPADSNFRSALTNP